MRGAVTVVLACACACGRLGFDPLSAHGAGDAAGDVGGGGGDGSNAAITAGSGALIIPTSASFQDDCGVRSAFALVAAALRANPWLASQGLPPVVVARAIAPAKASPNRCAPTSASVPPAPAADLRWSDGCDVVTGNAAGAPVTLVTNASASDATTDTVAVTIDTTARADVFPSYAAATIDATVDRVAFLGGPFVVPAAHAASLLQLLDGTLVATDGAGNAIDFSPFRDTSACTVGATFGVRIYRVAVGTSAAVPATAPLAAPARLAVLDQDQASTTGTIASGIFGNVLQEAGFASAGAQGCPVGGQDGGNATTCPAGATPGAVFDLFDFADLVANRATPDYGALWLPHWDSTAGSATPPNAAELTAAGNIAAFAHAGHLLLVSCSSGEALEGTISAGAAVRQASGPLISCASNDGTTCGATAVLGLDKDLATAPTGLLRDCTDPTTAAGATCALFGDPGDPLAQTADFEWDPIGGSFTNFLPDATNGAIYRPSVQPLVSGVASFDPSKLSTPRALVADDLVVRGRVADDPRSGSVLFVSGHDHAADDAGVLVLLATLFAD